MRLSVGSVLLICPYWGPERCWRKRRLCQDAPSRHRPPQAAKAGRAESDNPNDGAGRTVEIGTPPARPAWPSSIVRITTSSRTQVVLTFDDGLVARQHERVLEGLADNA